MTKIDVSFESPLGRWVLVVWLAACSLAPQSAALAAEQKTSRDVRPPSAREEVKKAMPTTTSEPAKNAGEALIRAAIRAAAASGRVLAGTDPNPAELKMLAPGKLPVHTVRLYEGGMKFRSSDLDTVIDDASH